jgi:hypothetical protein
VVEQDDAVGHPQRVVVGQRQHPGAELDVLRLRRRVGDEEHVVGDDLAPARVVLADPRLVEAEPVEVLDELDVALQRERRVLPHGQVVRGVEDAETHAVGHGRAPRDGGMAAARLRDERDLGEAPITLHS